MLNADIWKQAACVNLNALESVELYLEPKNQLCLVNVVEELRHPVAVILDKEQAKVLADALLEFAK